MEVWRCFVMPCSGRIMKEMLGFEGSGGVDVGEVALRGIIWSSIIGSVELCVECWGRFGGRYSGEDEVLSVASCCRGAEPLFQLAMVKG